MTGPIHAHPLTWFTLSNYYLF